MRVLRDQGFNKITQLNDTKKIYSQTLRTNDQIDMGFLCVTTINLNCLWILRH